ncbi:MAG: PaeR7I family type II restriction endonuclease [Actinomycetota bacterium]
MGKNINNRFEEALGTATDTWAAQAQFDAYGDVPPWLGYVFILCEDEETEKPDRAITHRPTSHWLLLQVRLSGRLLKVACTTSSLSSTRPARTGSET